MASSGGATQIAAWLAKPGHGARLKIRDDIEIPVPGEGELLVKLEYTGFCHSDVHSIYGETPMETDIAGHEGIGQVIQLGSNVSEEWLNTRVGIKWQYSTCGKCEICQVNPTACPNQHNSGRDRRGTFQQYIVAPAKETTKIPHGLKSEIAAPLLCAGLTMYSAVLKTRLKAGEWLLLPGAGGGLGHLSVSPMTHSKIQPVRLMTTQWPSSGGKKRLQGDRHRHRRCEAKDVFRSWSHGFPRFQD